MSYLAFLLYVDLLYLRAKGFEIWLAVCQIIYRDPSQIFGTSLPETKQRNSGEYQHQPKNVSSEVIALNSMGFIPL